MDLWSFVVLTSGPIYHHSNGSRVLSDVNGLWKYVRPFSGSYSSRPSSPNEEEGSSNYQMLLFSVFKIMRCIYDVSKGNVETKASVPGYRISKKISPMYVQKVSRREMIKYRT